MTENNHNTLKNKKSEKNKKVTPQNPEQRLAISSNETVLDTPTMSTTSEQLPPKEENSTMDKSEQKPQEINETHLDSLEKQTSKTDITPTQTETVVVKKGGSALGLLALLVALGLGGAGYYFGQLELNTVQQKLTALEQRLNQQPSQTAVDLPNFEQEKTAIARLTNNADSTAKKLAELEQHISIKEQAINALQTQINKLNASTKAEQPNDWLLSEADFLLNNALRKLILDNDVDTSISLLKVADETLSKVTDPRVMSVRTAINQDLKQLLSVNNVDQNAIMQRLSQLASSIDELTVLNVNFDETENTQLSASIDDWKENAEKSATSFLNHFIRITPRNAENKALLAPNQDIYLRENIRLRLQIAIMAVPRQQNDLYKQSLETVASWIRSYFDTSTETAQQFLKELDELAEQSIYVDVPTQLNSLNTLDKLLNKQPPEVQKIEISADKTIVEEHKKMSETSVKPDVEPTQSTEENKQATESQQ